MFGRKQVIAVAAALVAGLGLAALPGAPATAVVSSPARGQARAQTYTEITGAGSVWAGNAIDGWIGDVQEQYGLPVVYTANGSDTGRTDYQQQLVDFAVSDVPYRHSKDKLGNAGPEQTPLGYSYIPLVAGGVAFPYDLSVRGHAITNLRLSGETIMEIFTGQITNWDNPAITHDYGSQLPDIPIVPVVHAGSAGVSYYFTRWLAYEFPKQWNAFCDRVHRWIRPPCGATEFYPQAGSAQAMSTSSAVVSYVATTNGAIGYDEYAYPLAAGVPVAAVGNRAGRYVLPLAANVTTALEKAVVNSDHASPEFGEEDLDGVYTDKNPLSYPLSYYSYLIAPRSGTPTAAGFTLAKGLTLSAFAYYALCQGQTQLAPLGYAPLTRNLIRYGLKQIRRIPGHLATPSLSDCLDIPH